jgi:hypothetical protein
MDFPPMVVRVPPDFFGLLACDVIAFSCLILDLCLTSALACEVFIPVHAQLVAIIIYLL